MKLEKCNKCRCDDSMHCLKCYSKMKNNIYHKFVITGSVEKSFNTYKQAIKNATFDREIYLTTFLSTNKYKEPYCEKSLTKKHSEIEINLLIREIYKETEKYI